MIFTMALIMIKETHIGIPVKPMLFKKSAPLIASMVPNFVQLNKPWN